MALIDVKTCSKCLVAKPRDSFYRRKASLDGRQPTCKACKALSDKVYTRKNAIRLSEHKKEYRRINRESIARDMRLRYLADKDRYKERAKKWASTNREKSNTTKARYRVGNKDKVNALACGRRASRLRRTMPWDQDGILGTYRLADWMRKATAGFSGAGFFQKWHVDHTIPLCGETVSGLHVTSNLRVIPALENVSKRNSYQCL